MSSNKTKGLDALRNNILKDEKAREEYERLKKDPKMRKYEEGIKRRKEADGNAQNASSKDKEDDKKNSSNADYANLVTRLTQYPEKVLKIRDVGDNKKMWVLLLGRNSVEVCLDSSFLSQTRFSVEHNDCIWNQVFKVSFANEKPSIIEIKEKLTKDEIYNLQSKLYDFMLNYLIPTLQAALKDSAKAEIPSSNSHDEIPNLTGNDFHSV